MSVRPLPANFRVGTVRPTVNFYNKRKFVKRPTRPSPDGHKARVSFLGPKSGRCGTGWRRLRNSASLEAVAANRSGNSIERRDLSIR